MIKLGTTGMTKAYVGSTEVSKVYLGSELVYSSAPTPLPYDAEIEYLQSSGTQYIDLPLSVSAGTFMGIEGEVTFIYSNNTRNYIFAAKPSNVQFESKFYSYNSTSRYVTISSTIGNNASDGAWGGTAGIKKTFGLSTEGKTSNGTFTPLARNITDVITSFVLFGNGSNGYPIKFGWLKITVGTTLKYDLIPVRVGQVGYMYDKVSRQLFGNSGSGNFILGNDIPTSYDAQVEYLQSSGTQYIDTGLKIASGDIITLVFQTVGTQSTAFFGCRTSSSSGKCVIGSGSSSTIIYASLGSTANTKLADFDQNKHTIVLNTDTGKASIDGGSMVSIGTYSANNLSALLFACNQDGVVSLNSSIKIYSLEISNKLSLIPVRVGQAGYMYDTISGNYYGNKGSGSFILGNDITV